MRRRTRLLAVALAAAMTMTAFAPAKAAENDAQQIQTVSEEGAGGQEEEKALSVEKNERATIEETAISDDSSGETAEAEESDASDRSDETAVEADEASSDGENVSSAEENTGSAENSGTAGGASEEGRDRETVEAAGGDEAEDPVVKTDGSAGEIAENRKTDTETDSQAASDPEEPIQAHDEEAVQEDGTSNGEAADAAKKGVLSEPVKTDGADRATDVKEEKTDADAETVAAVSAETVSVTEPLYKIAAPDAADAGEGKWEEIIETIHHNEQGHYEKVQTGTKTVVDKEAWDEQRREGIYICSACGYESTSDDDITDHIADVHDFEASYGAVDRLVIINHPAETHEEPVYEDRWVVDTAAWDEEFHTGRMQYVVNGQPVRDSLVVIEGETYYLDRTGSPATGWMKIDGDWRYFDEAGKMQTGWQEKNGVRCYVDEATGNLALNEAKNVDGTDYYFDGTGAAHEQGSFTSDGKEYYFDGTDLVKDRWYTVGTEEYYFGSDGAKMTGVITVNGKTYPVGEDGSPKPLSLVTVSGKKYYTDVFYGWKRRHADRMADSGGKPVLPRQRRIYAHRMADSRRQKILPECRRHARKRLADDLRQKIFHGWQRCHTHRMVAAGGQLVLL